MDRVSRRLVLCVAMATTLVFSAVTPSEVSATQVMLGLYPQGPLQPPAGGIDEMKVIDAWIAGHQLMIAGDFMGLEFPNPDYNVPADLNGAWHAGYVPFVNLEAPRTSTEIANGVIDTAIRAWAHEFAKWAVAPVSPGAGPKPRRAFLAPLPEMNGNWTTYYNCGPPGGPVVACGPAAFVAAYRRIRGIFEEELALVGAPSTTISWVFAPNGATVPDDDFELYYPGSDVVDVVGFSAYNYGGCPPDAPWLRWDTFDLAILPFLDRMRALVPNKPVFLTQTASLARPVNGVGDKDVWLNDTYTKLAAYPGVRGVIYYNLQFPNSPTMPNCPDGDFRVHNPATGQWQGFRTALSNPPASNFVYYPPGSANLSSVVFARPQQIFADVVPIHPLLAGEPGLVDLTPWVHAIYNAGITGGCAVNPLRYCPDGAITRGQMAVFLLRAMRGGGYSPPDVTSTRFDDVPASGPSAHAFADWIEAFADAGVSGGCSVSPPLFCPNQTVTRGSMAVFLLRAMFGAGYSPPPATGVFSDVPASGPSPHPFAAWIEDLAAHGITGGCGGGNYCPSSAVSRAQMAIFLVRAFGL